MHEEDVLEVVVGEFVDVDFSGQVASEAAVDVLDGALLPGGVGIAEPGGEIEGLAQQTPSAPHLTETPSSCQRSSTGGEQLRSHRTQRDKH